MRYFCSDDRRRRNVIEARPEMNGIDFLEVLDNLAIPAEQRQRTLFVHFINDPSALGLDQKNVRVEGGDRIRDVKVISANVDVFSESGATDPVLRVDVDQPGDFSTYTLRLVGLDR